MILNLRTTLIAAVAGVLFGVSPGFAQQEEVFGDKLGFIPVANSNQKKISGTGKVLANLDGRTLTVSGTFDGLSTPATAANIHAGALGQNGPAVVPLEVSTGTSGTVEGSVELSDDQLAQLRESGMYVMIQSQQNPKGELRGWLVAGNEP